ncbi:hypothetical protein Tco_0454743 [Tanacetum coccineum]
MDTIEKLMPNNGQAVSQLEYSWVIGCLMYAMTCTRHDIAFAVGKLSRYTSNPSIQHWQEIQRVLKYLKNTMDYRLIYTSYPLVLKGYNDASWINNTKDNLSTSGWVFLFGGAAGKEAKWLKNLLIEILLLVKPIASISIRCDSVATLAKAYSQMYKRKFRYLGVKHSMIRELITNGVFIPGNRAGVYPSVSRNSELKDIHQYDGFSIDDTIFKETLMVNIDESDSGYDNEPLV